MLDSLSIFYTIFFHQKKEYHVSEGTICFKSQASQYVCLDVLPTFFFSSGPFIFSWGQNLCIRVQVVVFVNRYPVEN